MATGDLTDLQTRVRERMALQTADTFLTAARITNAVNNSIQQISLEYDWPWLQIDTAATITTVAGTTAYALPTDFLRAELIVEASTGIVLNRHTFRELSMITTRGRPLMYVVRGTKIHIRYIPDAVYTLSHYYIKRETLLASGADLPLIHEPFLDGVVEYSAYLLFRAIREAEKAGAAQTAYKAWKERSRDTLTQDRSTNSVYVRPGAQF